MWNDNFHHQTKARHQIWMLCIMNIPRVLISINIECDIPCAPTLFIPLVYITTVAISSISGYGHGRGFHTPSPIICTEELHFDAVRSGPRKKVEKWEESGRVRVTDVNTSRKNIGLCG